MPKTQQPELPGMPKDSPLAKLAKKIAAKREDIAEIKLEAEKLEKELVGQMKSEQQKRFKISDGVRNYEVNLVESSEHVRIAQVTKQRRDHVKVAG